jgi:hypothetical protein
MTSKQNAGRYVLTAVALFLALGPPVADLNATHVANPLWTGHARLHTVWLISTNSLIALISLGLLWIRPITIDKARLAAGLIGAILVGFFVAGATQSLYGGAFTDPNGIDAMVGPLDANLAAFSLHGILVLAALACLGRGEDGQAGRN